MPTSVTPLQVSLILYYYYPYYYIPYAASTAFSLSVLNKNCSRFLVLMKEGILILTKNGNYEVIFYEEIIYITVQQHYILLRLTDGRFLPARHSLKQIEKQLPPNIFFRIHRNYIAFLRHIKSVGEDSIIMKGGEEIPFAKNVRTSFLGLFTVLGSIENEGAYDAISAVRDAISGARALSSKPRQNPS